MVGDEGSCVLGKEESEGDEERVLSLSEWRTELNDDLKLDLSLF